MVVIPENLFEVLSIIQETKYNSLEVIKRRFGFLQKCFSLFNWKTPIIRSQGLNGFPPSEIENSKEAQVPGRNCWAQLQRYD